MGFFAGHRPSFAARAAALAAVVMTGIVATPAEAQAEPRPIMQFATANSISSNDRDTIATYADYWCQQLVAASDDPQAATRARDQLLNPVRARGATPVFRSFYGPPIVRGMRDAVRNSDSIYCTTNGMIVLAAVGTDDALDSLIDNCDPNRQRIWQVRLAAARGAHELLLSNRLTKKPNDFTSSSRDLERAVRGETNELVLKHKLLALLAAHRDGMVSDSRREVFENLAEALTDVAGVVSADGRADLLTATDPVITDFLSVFLRLDDDDKSAVAGAMAPALISILDAYCKVAPGVDDARREVIGRRIGRLQVRLGRLAGIGWPGASLPRGGLDTAWLAGADPFCRQVDEWRRIVQ